MQQVLFEKWWGRAVSVVSLAFVLWFVIVEFEGLVSFVNLLAEAILFIPDSIRVIIDYYASVPAGPLFGSVIVGAVFGAVTTAAILLSRAGLLSLPGFPAVAWVAALIVVGFLLAIGLNFYMGLLLGLVVLLAVGYIRAGAVRDFLSASTLGRLGHRRSLRLIGQGILAGSLAGAIGAQLLAFPMQHCTYAPDAAPVQRDLGFIVTALSALLVLAPVWTLAGRGRGRGEQGNSGYFKGIALPLAFLAPTLISLFVFLYYPAVQVATLSLNQVRGRRSRFACLDNYIDLVQDAIYQNSFTVTMTLTALIVALGMSLALLIALLAAQKVRGASIYRTLLIWPYALSPVVVGTVFLAMFRQGRTGLINYSLSETFGVTLNWFTNPDLAPWVIVFASVYNILGFNILFYVAGLQNIPQDLLEAAQIDGANIFERFFRIKLPLLSPFTFFLLVTNVTYSFYGIYGAVDTLTQGGPPLGLAGAEGGATDVLIYKLYEDAFAPSGQIGAAAAQSIILFVLVAVITILQFGFLERRVTYAE